MSPAIFAAVLLQSLAPPQHYVFFAHERHRIQEQSFLDNRNIQGAQLKYTWRELEPARDQYDLKPLLDDLAFLERHGKRLWVQLQDVSFSDNVIVPEYLRTDPAFGGGVAPQYEFAGDDESQAKFAGWSARRWDPAVRARFIKLVGVMARELDGRIEGLNFAETALGFGASGKYHPAGFSNAGYVAALKDLMSASRREFKRSHVMVYANFMPGEWLPGNDSGYMRAIYAHADSIGVAVGGPDLLPYRRGQRNHGLKFIAARAPAIVAGLAVQDGNLAERNPATNQPATVEELYRYAVEQLRLDYIFWGTEEPYYSAQVLPFLQSLTRRDFDARTLPSMVSRN